VPSPCPGWAFFLSRLQNSSRLGPQSLGPSSSYNSAGKTVDNKAIATIFYETADLMEINGDDSFRIRSYRRAAETIEGLP